MHKPKGPGGRRPGAGRKPDPHAMSPENTIKLHLPDDLAGYVAGVATATGESRQHVVRNIIRRSLEAAKKNGRPG